jgi:hypothetical protein
MQCFSLFAVNLHLFTNLCRRFTAVKTIEQRAFNKLRSPYAVHTHKLMAYLDFAGIDGSSSRN